MHKFIQLVVFAFLLGSTACLKENVQSNLRSSELERPSAEAKAALNDICPVPLGSALNRVEIESNKAIYHLMAFGHNTGAHWFLWELSGPAGTVSKIVTINTNDDAQGNLQIFEMGTISYPKDACFTLTIYGYLTKPKKKEESCSLGIRTGIICPADFPAL